MLLRAREAFQPIENGSRFLIIDTRRTLETPEGTDLPLYPAGPWIRSLAYTIDWLIRSASSIAVGFVFSGSGLGQAMILITYFLLEWFYPVLFEIWRDGQTPGKKAMRLKVVNDDGTPVTFSSSLLRNLLRVVDFLPAFYIGGIVTSVCNRDFKRLGDLAAGTLVVYNQQVQSMPTLDDVGSRPVPTGFSTDEQRMLVAFAQRGHSLSAERQQELAQLLGPILSEPDKVATIKQMANHIVGKR